MRKVLMVIVLTVAFGMTFVATAATEAHADGYRHVSAKVCKTLLYKHGPRKAQCKRQGWFYAHGHYTETDGRVVYWGEVYGPRGRCYLDFPYGDCSPTGPVIR